MKKILTFILIFISVPCIAGEYTRNFLQIVLNNMQENYQHSIGVPLGRYVLYVDKEGKREAVYDTKNGGNLVTDPVNQGSYNYFPYQQGIKHFLYDSFVWLNIGNSDNDTSSYHDRLMAWIDDFAVSFEKVCRVNPSLLRVGRDKFEEDTIFANTMETIFKSILLDTHLENTLSSNPCILFDNFKNGNQDGLLYLREALIENFKTGPLTPKEVDELYYSKMPQPEEFKN